MIEIIPLYKLKPVNTQNQIRIPGSKSYTNRALILSALAKGKSVLINPLESDDTKVLVAALRKLGTKIEKKPGRFIVYGNGGHFRQPSNALNLGNAGTAVRFLTAALASAGIRAVITGNKRMKQRPVGDLVDALTKLGAEIATKNGYPPIRIKKSALGGTTTVKGDISSQYLSALLISAPAAKNGVTVKVEGRMASLPYVRMTLDAMAKFGVRIPAINLRSFTVMPSPYKPAKYIVEGDASSASYHFAIAALNRCRIKLINIRASSAQADIKFLKILQRMGCKIKTGANFVSVLGPAKLRPLGRTDMSHMPDSAMTAAVLCAFADGKSTLTGLGNLRVKECDRLRALSAELTKIGAAVKAGNDYLEIAGNPDSGQSAVIDTYDDHRMAMCFAVAGSKIPGIKIRNPECVSKTYPGFWKDLGKIGLAAKPVRPLGGANIVLSGLRGTGKTVIGRRLAKLLGYRFVDTDKYVQDKEKRTIARIFSESGWRYFRKMENSAAKEIGKKTRTVISTGGGMFTDDRNAGRLKKNGIVILLTCNPETASTRIRKDRNRPPLTGLKNTVKELELLWKRRRQKYLAAADLIIDTSGQSDNIRADIDDKAKKIISLLNAR